MNNSSYSDRLSQENLRNLSDQELANFSVELAATLLTEAKKHETSKERGNAAKIGGMIDDEVGKALTLNLADQVFRATSPERCASQFRHLVEEYGIPKYLKGYEKIAMKAGAAASAIFPDLVIPLVTEKMRQESSDVILPAKTEKLNKHLQKRTSQGQRVNINLLGEAILGEAEAAHRLEGNLELLRNPNATYISVKISNIFSQLNLLAFEDTITHIQHCLRKLYREAISNAYVDENGKKRPKFVNLDMEEYRDLQLTTEAFQRTLEEEEFKNLEAGIVLQGYLPDSWQVQKDLTAWAQNRISKGGAGIKIRLVKGANLAMEGVDAEIHDWEIAPYRCKSDVDANFKRMVEFGTRPENAAAVRIGIASHNLFDIAYALVLRARNGVEKQVEFEMLEGMANHQAKSVQDASGGMLLYAPIVHRQDFHSAIAYLVRRLDENTSEDNFLRDLFTLEVGSSSWNDQRDRFLKAVREKDSVRDTPYRDQDRSQESNRKSHCQSGQKFSNEPDTDWTSSANRKWINQLREERLSAPPEEIPLVIDGEENYYDLSGTGHDPSRPGVVAYRYALAKMEDVDRALEVAHRALPEWSSRSIPARKALLDSCGDLIASKRGELLAIMTLDGGKSIVEADPEISEAIDFATYYARGFDFLEEHPDVTHRPLGCVVIAPPWNFPFAIPCGGVLAALMAGNTVILKPAPQATLCGWHLAKILWEAGIPKDVLQFVPAPDNEIGRHLITSSKTNGVILTGAYETGRLFQDWKPEIKLFAETSGKNSLIITAAADLDLAVKDAIKAAFGNNGQKCSAASLLIVEASVYDHPLFMQQLKDATESLKVGSAWDPASTVTPVVEEPQGALARGLSTLDPGEEWLLEPKIVDGNPSLWSPGIRIGVKPGSWYHRNECFGPIMGVIRADSFEHAMEIQNDSTLGLTGGIHSLDTREISIWREKVEVGNAYINRSITGAIVNRQPFGGWKNSVFGPGTKAGGPNYVLTLCNWKQTSLPSASTGLDGKTEKLMQSLRNHITDAETLSTIEAAAASYAKHWENEFSKEHDPTGLIGETNHFRYRPYAKGILLRIGNASDSATIACAALAATITKVPLEISLPEASPLAQATGFKTVIETSGELSQRLAAQEELLDIVRIPGEAATEVWEAANSRHFNIVNHPVLANGRIELMYWLKEQAISQTTHRYGNIIAAPPSTIQEKASATS
ncbi:proline dehydrogenase family protein [Luteolibacter sp. AS25]|uniref:proline dehydrogenase family protein n=1 Tax=Luteolibacter sp. AS25 TaxID=3135776 RepID=UPI00398B07B5